jgi:hypothetical protein
MRQKTFQYAQHELVRSPPHCIEKGRQASTVWRLQGSRLLIGGLDREQASHRVAHEEKQTSLQVV